MTKFTKTRGLVPFILIAGAAFLAACAPSGGDYLETVALTPEPAAAIPTSTRACNANEMGWLIGQPETTLAAVALAGSVAVVNAGGAMPSGNDPQRLVVMLDADGRIAQLICG